MNIGDGAATILAALLGAMLGGGINALSSFFARRRETQNCLTAIAVEVESICRLIRFQGYREEIAELLDDLQSGRATAASYVVDVRSHYFSVFEGLSPKLGQLAPDDSIQIVRFYSYCKALIDSTRPDGVGARQTGGPEGIAAFQAKLVLVNTILGLGDCIVQLPKCPIPVARLQ